MIATTTETTITCDTCGKVIAPGELWFQLVQSVSRGTFDGSASGLEPIRDRIVQLCQTDWQDARGKLAKVGPLANDPAVVL